MTKVSFWVFLMVFSSFSSMLWASVITGEIQSVNQQLQQLKVQGKTFYANKRSTVSMTSSGSGPLTFSDLAPGMLVEVYYITTSDKQRREIKSIKLLIH